MTFEFLIVYSGHVAMFVSLVYFCILFWDQPWNILDF